MSYCIVSNEPYCIKQYYIPQVLQMSMIHVTSQ